MVLWDNETINDVKDTIHHPSAKAFWTSPQTRKDKLDTLDIGLTGSVSVLLAMGPIKASGSFKYLDDKKVM